MKKRLYSVKITKELDSLIKYLISYEEVTQVVFVRRAINDFMNGDREIDVRLMIRKRNDKKYIKRDTMYTVWIEEFQIEQLKQVADEKNTQISNVFFQAIADYCSKLINTMNINIDIKHK